MTPKTRAAWRAFAQVLTPEHPTSGKTTRFAALYDAVQEGPRALTAQDDALLLALFGQDESADAKFERLRAFDPYAIGVRGTNRLIAALRESVQSWPGRVRQDVPDLRWAGIFGTGGDHSATSGDKLNTLNISTLAAIVAGALRPEGTRRALVMKVGSPAVTSRIGAANLMARAQGRLGEPGFAARLLLRHGFMFMSPGDLGLPYLATLVEARRRVWRAGEVDPIKIIVPAACLMDPYAQVTGVSDPRMLPFVIGAFEALVNAGVIERAIVVHSYTGMDEFMGDTLRIDVDTNGWQITDIGFDAYDLEVPALPALGERADVAAQWSYSRSVLAGEAPRAVCDVIAANAGLVLEAMGEDLGAAIARCREGIERGVAVAAFDAYVADWTNREA